MHPLWDATTFFKKISHNNYISIHASLMGCNGRRGIHTAGRGKFQFMHPLWDATRFDFQLIARIGISIHASLMGCNDIHDTFHVQE